MEWVLSYASLKDPSVCRLKKTENKNKIMIEIMMPCM